VVLRARNVDALGFNAALFEEEYLMDGHAKEQFAYLAIYHPDAVDGNLKAGRAILNGATLDYGLTRAAIGHAWTEVAGVELKLEEEQSLDAEIAHLQERVDVLEIAGQVFAQDVSSRGRDTAAPRQR
jgi:hypothetical protein